MKNSKRVLLRTLFVLHFAFLILNSAFANRISGSITDEKNAPLPFASILVKGTPTGTTANNEGKYFLNLAPGSYTIVAQYVGYQRLEKMITVTNAEMNLDFQLQRQSFSLKEVVVRPGAEDPAYAIIRNAIKKRPFYLEQLDRFQCEVYTKGIFQLRDFPKKFFGQKVDFEDGDTSKRKILYLSETVARYSVDKPSKSKIEVLSTKVSGQSDGFGFSAPQIVSFYENNLQFGSNLNPRGFISPIAENALNFYKYKYEGSFFEEGKEINRIKVIPKRKFEPLFSGHINIVENDWRIHSVQLQLTKESQMALVDTLRVEQLYVPLQNDIWVIKTQVIYPAIKMFGFDAFGNFVNVYSKFDTDPPFENKFFNNTILKYDEGSNKRPANYWDSIRPVPLRTEEIKDYFKKDSLEQVRRDPHYKDSMDRIRNKITPMNVLVSGQGIRNEKKRSFINIDPVIQSIQFNTVEGWALNFRATYFKRLDTLTFSRKSFSFTPVIRYGFSNRHVNALSTFVYSYRKKYASTVSVTGGKMPFQFNNANPVPVFGNTISSLFFERNYIKLYEAWTGRITFSKSLDDGLRFFADINYQDRMPLENTSVDKFRDSKNRVYSPNFPAEIMSENFLRHQALITSVGVTWRPGSKYVEFPDRKISLGSKYPTLSLTFTKGLQGVLGSDIDYAKWRFGIRDNINLKLLGAVRYNIVTGGFLQRDSVAVPDYTHFSGNQIVMASPYLSSFQLLPYYLYSNKAPHYVRLHVEHHYNGFLTNKIPLFRRLNWNMITGLNSFYVNSKNNYIEPFVGLENILRIVRVDLYWGIGYGRNATTGFRIGVTGFTGAGDD